MEIKQNKMDWIPVSERLPECVDGQTWSEDVLVFNHASTVGYYDKSEDKWYSNWAEDYELTGVTHWMEIPVLKK